MSKRQEFIDGLRAVADFYENHPEAHYDEMGLNISMYAFTDDPKAAVVTTAKAMGKCEKEYCEEYFTIRKEFSGAVSLSVFAKRSKVCQAVKVGERVIPEHIVPATTEIVIPERTEDIIKWQCEPLLAGASGGSQQWKTT